MWQQAGGHQQSPRAHTATGRAARAEPRGWNPDAGGGGGGGGGGGAGTARRRRRPPNFTRTPARFLEGVHKPSSSWSFARGLALGGRPPLPSAASRPPPRAGTAAPGPAASSRPAPEPLPHAAPGPSPSTPRSTPGARARHGVSRPGERRRHGGGGAREAWPRGKGGGRGVPRVSHLFSWPRRGRGGRDLSRSASSSSCFMEPCAWMEAPERSRLADGPDARRKPGGAKGTVGWRRKRRRRPGRTRGIPWAAGGLSRAGTRFLRYPSSHRRQ